VEPPAPGRASRSVRLHYGPTSSTRVIAATVTVTVTVTRPWQTDSESPAADSGAAGHRLPVGDSDDDDDSDDHVTSHESPWLSGLRLGLGVRRADSESVEPGPLSLSHSGPGPGSRWLVIESHSEFGPAPVAAGITSVNGPPRH
jgi:hypothetical protein